MIRLTQNDSGIVVAPYSTQIQFSILHFVGRCFSRFNLTRSGFILLFLCSVFFQIESHAHGDEDHGAAPPPLPTQGTAARFSVSSEELELVAVYSAQRLTIYLDHFADNTPVTHAKLEIEGAGVKATAQEIEAGVYVIDLPNLTPAIYPFTISVDAGDIVDLLAASLTISAEEGSDGSVDTAHGNNGGHLSWKTWALAGGGLLMLTIATVMAVFFLRRRQLNISKMGDKHHV
jgi:hypothetical protein